MNILITGAGGAATPALVNYYEKRPDYNLVLADMSINPYLKGINVDVEQIPPAGSPDFVSAIDKIVGKYNINVVLPLVDEEIIPILNYYAGRNEPYIMTPKIETARLTLNKLQLNKHLEKNGINVPLSCHIDESDSIDDSFLNQFLIAKPVSGRGSRGIYFSNSVKEAGNLVNYLKLIQPDTMLQQLISGTEYTVSMLCSKNGEILGIVPKRIISKRGITIDAVTEKNEVIEQYCRQIQEALAATGPLNIQMILNEEGIPYVFEINPRLSTTTILTMMAGFDEIEISINDYYDKEIINTGWKEGIRLYRTWNNHFFSVNRDMEIEEQIK